MTKQLEEPLLPRTTTTDHGCHYPVKPTKWSGPCDARSSSSSSSKIDNPVFISYVKIIAFMIGSLMALLSQFVLAKMYWSDEILKSTTLDVIYFSFVWSCWTCAIIFSVMISGVYAFDTVYDLRSNLTSRERRDDLIFVLEAHYVVGALIFISIAWILVDALRLGVPSQTVQHSLFLALTAIWYGVCMYVFNRNAPIQDENSTTERQQQQQRAFEMFPTYQLIAATLGLIVGVCSQFILSFLLWRDHMTTPVFDNLIVFSTLWSLCTVVITFVGCATLRCLTMEEPNRALAERAFLRMESHYVFASLCGICLAWILIDLVMDMTEQIIPSLVMLTIALVAFRAILSCFPEEQCLADMELDGETETVEVARTKKQSTNKKSRPIVLVQLVDNNGNKKEDMMQLV